MSCVAKHSKKSTITGRDSPKAARRIQCGWLKDKFGLCWQIWPVQILSLIRKPKAFQAMLKMKKIDLAELERAAGE